MSQVRVPLEVLRVQTQCTEDWGRMSGDARTRYCAGCGLHVHNLSAMTRGEAERLVCERAGRLCVRYERDAAGQVVTLDYQQASDRKGRWRLWALLGGAGAVAAAIAAAVNPFGTVPGATATMGMISPRQNNSPGVVMGDMGPEHTIPPDFIGPPAPGTARTRTVMGALPAVAANVTLNSAGPLGPPAPGDETVQGAFTADPR